MSQTVIDQEQFLSLIEGDKELFKSLLELFSKEGPDLISQLNVALEKKDTEAIIRIEHRLKGNLKNFYANDAAKIAEEIEMSGGGSQIDDLPSKINQLESALSEVTAQLENLYKNL